MRFSEYALCAKGKAVSRQGRGCVLCDARDGSTLDGSTRARLSVSKPDRAKAEFVEASPRAGSTARRGASC